MRRDYAGATTRTALAGARELGPDWCLQPKIDGMYATVLLDGRGAVHEVLARSGLTKPLPRIRK